MRMVTVAKGDTLWQIARRNGVSLEALLRANPQIRDPNKIYPGDKVFIPGGAEEAAAAEVPQAVWAGEPPKTDWESDGKETAVNHGGVYVAKRGDTLTSVARRFGVGREFLAAANGQIGSEALSPGAQLYLPGFHRRSPGESLYEIADRYGVGLEALLAANPRIDDSEDINDIDRVTIPRRDNGDIGVYAVKPGDSLYKIGRKYNLPVSALMKANPDLAGDRIDPGQVLRVPGPHIASGNQTLADIAAVYVRDTEELAELNEGLGEGNIAAGTSVRLPTRRLGCRAAAADGVAHSAAEGDTAEDIAALYHVSLGALLAANPGLSRGRLARPTALRIPTGSVERLGYAARSGDSLRSVASRYGLTAEALARANPRFREEEVRPGDVLMIPIREARQKPAPKEWETEPEPLRNEWETGEEPLRNEWETEPLRNEWETEREAAAAEWAGNGGVLEGRGGRSGDER